MAIFQIISKTVLEIDDGISSSGSQKKKKKKKGGSREQENDFLDCKRIKKVVIIHRRTISRNTERS